jgi:hypothetical protein
MRSAKAILSALAAAALAMTAASTAEANKCTRLAFSVNDYGKEGPTKDALQLLDKHIAQWASSYGVKKYTVGKKDVSCELFLDVILFDEYTCKASAAVCWTDGPPAPVANPEAEVVVKTPAAASAKAPATAAKKK